MLLLLIRSLIPALLLPSLLVSAENIDQVINLDYRVYPRRSKDEAAVLEWGHSAVISALEASVAWFGPQTSEAALLEVETMPVLASPINGVHTDDDGNVVVQPLDNAEQVHGNLVVMTNMGDQLTGVQMAKIAQDSGAAALLVVNINEDNPEYIYRLPADEGAEEIQIPVAMISMNSATALTTATITSETKRRDIVNNGMPDRVRLYAGGDRPFFEDVEAAEPTVYLIHNLLTEEECDALIQKAEPRFRPVQDDALQLTQDSWKMHQVDRVMLWQGMLRGPSAKQIEERIEQVTGFPSDHFSDFVVDRYEEGSYWQSHYDTIPGIPGNLPLATITIFLSEDPEGAGFVYPSTRSDPIKVQSVKGMAVVHHNTDQDHQFEMNAVHALLPASQRIYTATKFIYPAPLSKARRIALPIFALPFGGRLPSPVVALYKFMVQKFNYEQGGSYFDKVCVFLSVLMILSIAQYAAEYAQKKLKSKPKENAKVEASAKATRSKRKKA